MSAMAELWHVVKKDVRHSKWLLCGYAVLVIIATVSALSIGKLADGYLQLAAMLLLFVGPLTAALLVQADSPIRADAFWAGQPFRRWVMLVAKLTLVIGFLLLLPLIGQLLALRAFAVPAHDVGGIIAVSALSYGFVLLLAMFLAALTRDIRSFVLAVVGILIALLVMGLFVSEAKWSWGTPALRGTVVALAIGGALVLLVLLYMRRDLPAARPIGVALLAMMLLGGVSSDDSSSHALRAASAVDIPQETAPGAVGIAVELRDTSLIERESRLDLRVSLTGEADSRRYRLDSARARFYLRGGTTLDIPLLELGASHLAMGPMKLPGAPAIEQDDRRFWGTATGTQRYVSSKDRRALVRGIDSVRLTTRLTAFAPGVFATLPVHVGAGILRDGQAIRIEDLAQGSVDDLLSLHVLSAGTTSDVFGLTTGSDMDAVLVNERRAEGAALSRTGSSSNPGLLVLPGASVHQGTIKYSAPRTKMGELVSSDSEWLHGAKLLLVAWKPIESYTVTATSRPLARPVSRTVGPYQMVMPPQPLKLTR